MASRPIPSPSDRYDWHAAYRSPEFARLAGRRGRFVRASVFALLGWFAVFLAVLGAAPALAGTVVFAGMTVGFLLGLSQFVLAWLLTWRYLRISETVFTDLEAAAVSAAVSAAGDGSVGVKR